MKYPLIAAGLITSLGMGDICVAWDGFDADTAELVEVIPDELPNAGDRVEVRNYDTDTTAQYFVESVRRNRRTIELVIRDDDGHVKTLVMEGR